MRKTGHFVRGQAREAPCLRRRADVSGGVKMQETSRFENEVTLGGKWDGWTRTESELALPRAEEDGFMEDLEEDPAEEDRCAPGGKKTQPKKTTFSNRLNYRTFRMAMTD
ncbi:MAG TPA: hypothetical protein VLM89_11570 [Phycisphaerae bacterium]|nr:hypothetical protein [Phycisphaerae bacterium]